MDRIAPIMECVCRGLAAAHASNVVHRDVKPENIFLHEEPEREVVKILDFGIAKVMDQGRLQNANLTSTGDIVGSPYYMAPERLLGRESDASADSYSVGLILYRALTGRLPFEGTVSEIVLQAVTKRPPEIAEMAPSLPTEVARVIMRALEDDPARRPAVTEIAETLSRIATHAASSAA
jgi:serine/threonine protein kinase